MLPRDSSSASSMSTASDTVDASKTAAVSAMAIIARWIRLNDKLSFALARLPLQFADHDETTGRLADEATLAAVDR
jgi:hypothetical protein